MDRSRTGVTPTDAWHDEASFRSFVEEADDLMTVVDREGRLVYANPAFARLVGVARDELIGRSAFDFVHPDDLPATREAFRGWIAGRETHLVGFTNRQRGGDGTYRNVSWNVHPHHEAGGAVRHLASFARDVTVAQRQQDALSSSERHLRSILDGLLDAVVTIDPFGVIQNVNRAAEALFGWTRGELVGRNVKVFMPEPHHSRHDEYLAHYRRTGQTWILNTTREFDVLRKDGSRFVCALSVSRVDLLDGAHVFCGSFRDVTERTRAEEALAESERRFRAIFDQEYQYVGLLDPEGRVLEMNQAALQAIGRERAEVLGRPFEEAPWWQDDGESRARIRAALASAARGEFVHFEVSLNTAHHGARSIDFSLKPIPDESGRVVLIIPEGRDITMIKRAQERETSMLRALATIGESAAVLAHEIKSPITAVNLALRAVADRLGEDQKAVIEELAERMGRLQRMMKRTLSLAKPLELHARPCDLRRCLDAVLAPLRAECEASDGRVEIDVAPRCPPLLADEVLLEELLTNLVRNALEALERGGRVRVSAAPEGDHVVLQVEDDGPGIAEDLWDQVFRPFFSTKAQGTGVGLALCKKIVEEHGGTIAIDRAPLGGARFRIEWPAAERADAGGGSP